MTLFRNDYQSGCIPEIMDLMVITNLEQTPGYGTDAYCSKAAQLIKEQCGLADADVHFLVGGTQTNSTVISSILRPHQGVVCATSGHIAVHETGAIEHSGHKVLDIPAKDGKICIDALENFLNAHFNQDSPEHEVQPGMVYISFSTELGTIYSKVELQQIRQICNKWSLPLFIDGARLGYGLASYKCDITLKELASLADVFYIGGTKQGALMGEAVVFRNIALSKDFRYIIKQNGGLLAKGRLLGIQFLGLFTDNNYLKYASHANNMACKISDALKTKGYGFFAESPTNQLFPVFPNELGAALSQEFGLEKWTEVDNEHTAYRICTSWATAEEDVNTLISRF